MGTQGTGIVGISNYIKATLLASVTNLRQSNIYDYETADLTGFPAATITMQELQGRVLDNARNERVYRFTIRVFIDRNMTNFGPDKAETVLRTIADQFVKQIDQDPTLGGSCIDVTPFGAKFGYVERENNNIRVMEIDLDCKDANTWR